MMRGELMLSAGADSAFRLDPRTKLLLLLLVNLCVFGSANLAVMLVMAAIPILLLFSSRKWAAALFCSIGYIAAILMNEYLVPTTQGAVNVIVVMISGMLCRLMPGFIMGYYVVITTTVSEFIASMEKLHIPNCVTIPLSVVFRFFPTVLEEARSITDAMRMRGVSFGTKKFFTNPLAMIEYRLIPLMMSTVKIGDELSAASLTRGLGGPVRRTNICKIGLGFQDYLLILIAVCGYLFFLFS